MVKPKVCDAQLAATQIGRRECPGAKCPEECPEEIVGVKSGGMSRSSCRITSLRVAVMIWATMVNTQTDTRTHRQLSAGSVTSSSS